MCLFSDTHCSIELVPSTTMYIATEFFLAKYVSFWHVLHQLTLHFRDMEVIVEIKEKEKVIV